MGVEIERKFLLKDKSVLSSADRVEVIKQGYLKKSTPLGVRIRTLGDKGFITIKGPKDSSSLSRLEYEYEIPIQDALELIALSGEQIVEKQRHYIQHEGKVWEVDVFEGANEGLLLAEVELPDEDTRVAIPDWIGEEVTDDEHYYNSYLAQHSYTTWPSKKD